MATQPVALFESKYTPELASSIVQRIGTGENLRAIMRDVGMDWSTFYRWLRNDPQLQADYEEARILGAHAIAHDALALLEQQPERVDKRIDPGFVQWQRLKIEGTLKILAKWFPAHYGDKLLHAGHDGGAIKSETALSVKELAAQLRARASGVTIDGDAKEMLTVESERFNATSVSNEGQTDDRPALPSRPKAPKPERRPDHNGASDQQGARSVDGTARSTEALAVDVLRDGRRSPSDVIEAQGTGPAAPSEGLVPGARQRKARSRGVGGPGGGQKRGASAQMSGTPAPQILEISQKSNLTNNLQFPENDDWSPEDYV